MFAQDRRQSIALPAAQSGKWNGRVGRADSHEL